MSTKPQIKDSIDALSVPVPDQFYNLINSVSGGKYWERYKNPRGGYDFRNVTMFPVVSADNAGTIVAVAHTPTAVMLRGSGVDAGTLSYYRGGWSGDHSLYDLISFENGASIYSNGPQFMGFEIEVLKGVIAPISHLLPETSFLTFIPQVQLHANVQGDSWQLSVAACLLGYMTALYTGVTSFTANYVLNNIDTKIQLARKARMSFFTFDKFVTKEFANQLITPSSVIPVPLVSVNLELTVAAHDYASMAAVQMAQTALFKSEVSTESAVISKRVSELAKAGLQDPDKIRLELTRQISAMFRDQIPTDVAEVLKAHDPTSIAGLESLGQWLQNAYNSMGKAAAGKNAIESASSAVKKLNAGMFESALPVVLALVSMVAGALGKGKFTKEMSGLKSAMVPAKLATYTRMLKSNPVMGRVFATPEEGEAGDKVSQKRPRTADEIVADKARALRDSQAGKEVNNQRAMNARAKLLASLQARTGKNAGVQQQQPAPANEDEDLVAF